MDSPPLGARSAAQPPAPDLLVTRLHPPHVRPDLVARSRLSERLRRGRRGPLTLVVAPAGSGKTTAVTAWLSQDRALTAWLSLSDDGNDPARFWAYLAAACDRLAPGCAESVQALLQPQQPPAPAALVATLSNSLAALPWEGSPERPYVLVLDDYHAIDRQEIHAGVARLVEQLPPQVHLVITARADPPLPLARLRARGQLSELREADLRFTAAELAEMIAAAGEPSLSEAALATLTARTEGWAAGLQLAILALRDHPDPEGFVAAFAGSHRYLVDYLTDDVLEQQPSHLRRFLLDTSILDRMCGPLCDAVLGLEDTLAPGRSSYSQLLLDEVERRGIFLIPLDDERRWYRYHHLFADVLRTRLHALAPEREPALHRRACAWYAAAAAAEPALLAQAVRHALAAGDTERAADLVDRSATLVWNQGSIAGILELLHMLPAPAIWARPRLALVLARATLSAGDLAAVGPILARVASAIDGGAATSGVEASLRGWVAAIAAHEARLREQLDTAFAQARQALALIPADDQAGRGFATLGLAMTHHVAGDLAAASERYAAAIPLLLAAGDRYSEVVARAMHGTAALMRGDLAAAEALLGEALGRAQVGRTRLPVAAMALNALGEIAYLRDDLERAQRCCAEGLSLAELGEVRDAIFVGHELRVKIDLARGDAEAAARRAAALIARAEAAHIPLLAAWSRSIAAWADIARGRMEPALRWAAGYRPAAGPLSPIRADEFMTYLRVLLAAGRAAEACDLVAQQLPHAAAAGNSDQRIQILALGALASAAQGDRATADERIGAALALAAPDAIRRPFLSAGPPMAELLRAYAARRHVAEPLRSFAARLAGEPTAASPPAPAPAAGAAALVEQLTAREREILAMAASGHSNQEIADMLVIGVGTVKTHLHSLYGKLDARDRMSAVVRARALGLIE